VGKELGSSRLNFAGVFERFTDRARRVVVLAQEEARMLNHNYIGTEHILLGLVHEGKGVAAKALESLGTSLEAVRQQVEEIIGQGKAAPRGHIPFTSRAKKALELSLPEALQLGHDYIGTEHILLGLIREGEGVGAQVLQELGAGLEPTRQKVLQLLGEPSAEISERIPPFPERAEPLPPFIREVERKIAQASTEKDAALDKGDAESAVQFRGEERRLIEQKTSFEKEWMSATNGIRLRMNDVRSKKAAAIDAQDFARAAKLRDEERRLLEELATLRRTFGQPGSGSLL
jgi:ATP-dependent Clp protease ATP-binding subunit ClpA